MKTKKIISILMIILISCFMSTSNETFAKRPCLFWATASGDGNGDIIVTISFSLRGCFDGDGAIISNGNEHGNVPIKMEVYSTVFNKQIKERTFTLNKPIEFVENGISYVIPSGTYHYNEGLRGYNGTMYSN